MKKIIILILLLFNTAAHFLKAQEATSTLTQVTTDLLQADARTNFNWRNVNPTLQQNTATNNTMARNALCWFFCKVLGWKRWCSDDVTNTGGNDAVFGGKCPGSGSGGTGIKLPYLITVTTWPHIKPDDWMPNNPNLPTDQGGGGGGESPNDPHDSPPTDPDKDPRHPIKPTKVLEEDIPNILNNPTKVDTVKPTKVDCDTLTMSKDSMTNRLVDSLSTLPIWKELHDTALYGKNEIGASFYDSSGISKLFKASSVGANSQQTSITVVDTTTGVNHKNINAIAHPHYVGLDPIPDCGDVYALLTSRVIPSKYKNPYLNHSFVICGDPAVDLALRISDTLAAVTFLNLFFENSAIHYLDTAANGTKTDPVWSPTYKGEVGFELDYPMGSYFDKAVDVLRKKNYSKQMLWTYAQAYMLKKLNVGAVLLQKIGSEFRQLSIDFVEDSKGMPKDIIVNICK